MMLDCSMLALDHLHSHRTTPAAVAVAPHSQPWSVAAPSGRALQTLPEGAGPLPPAAVGGGAVGGGAGNSWEFVAGCGTGGGRRHDMHIGAQTACVTSSGCRELGDCGGWAWPVLGVWAWS